MNINSDIQEILFPFSESEFLNTAFRVKMNAPHGILTYLEMVDQGPDKEGFGQLALEARKKQTEVNNYQVEAIVDKQNAEALRKDFNINIDQQNYSVIKNEADQNIQKLLFDLYSKLGKKSQIAKLTKWQKFLMQKFGMKFPTYVKNEREVVNKLVLFSNWIGVQSRRGIGNFVVVGSQVGSYIQDDARFEFSNDRVGLINGGEIRYIGNVGNLKVFVNPYLKYTDLSVIVGGTTSEGEAGVFFGEYDRRAMKLDVWSPLDFAPQTKYRLMDRVVIDSVSDESHKNYYKTDLIIGNKPFWRKLIRA